MKKEKIEHLASLLRERRNEICRVGERGEGKYRGFPLGIYAIANLIDGNPKITIQELTKILVSF